MKTNIAAKFLKMVTRHFPKTQALHKMFNRHTLKVSYSTTRNIKKHISRHNYTMLNKNKPEKEKKMCNCRRPENCLLNGECQEGPIVYQADLRTRTSSMKYISSTARLLKERCSTQKRNLNNRNANSTALSSYVWTLKDAEEEYKISWNIVARTGVYTAGAKFCDLCLTEKTYFILAEPKESVNIRSEILNKCRHKSKFMLAKI